MKLLFIGDVVGHPGRKAVKELLPKLKAKHGLDVVIANGENAAGGSGITYPTAKELYDAGVDALTMGDHIWDQKEVMGMLEKEKRLVRPLNYPAGVPGSGLIFIEKEGLPVVAIMNVQGRTFMPALENPFTRMLEELPKALARTPIIFVDIHAEATSEKIAMGRMLDGKVSAVIGTHTHVQTADEQIFPGGTAFLCDAGFTGGQESVIGREIEPIVQRFLTNMPQRFGVTGKRVFLKGAIVDIDNATGKARSIERVSEPLPDQPNEKA